MPPTGRPGKNSRRATEVAQRRREVAALYLTGLQQTEIADRMEVSKATISRDMDVIRRQWMSEATRDLGEWMAREVATLNFLQRSLLPSAATGDAAQRVRAARAVLDVMHHRAKLLGLYAPERHEVFALDVIDRQIRELERQLALEGPRELTGGA